tara:strand:- start:1488 stop:1856 length:369 start_codon:yes stop_codon:yes gene_type:complete
MEISVTMKAKELRIGNLFNEKYSNKTIEVIGLAEDRIDFSGCYLAKWQAEPIPLTEEWLLKFGFYKPFIGGGLALRINESSIIRVFDNGDIEIGNEINFNAKHVHKLQNVYFELTNKELLLQ